jgi:hypothetical protein
MEDEPDRGLVSDDTAYRRIRRDAWQVYALISLISLFIGFIIGVSIFASMK